MELVEFFFGQDTYQAIWRSLSTVTKIMRGLAYQSSRLVTGFIELSYLSTCVVVEYSTSTRGEESMESDAPMFD